MNKIDLLKNAVARIGYTAKKVHLEGCVARIETTEDDILDIYLTERKRQQIDDACFSLSHDGIMNAEYCKCDYLATFFGNVGCCVVSLAVPDFVSRDEFSEKIYTYKNPLNDAQAQKER